MRNQKKKGDSTTVIFLLIFLAGLSLLLYPTVSNWWNNRNQLGVIDNYTQNLNELNAEKYAALWAEAKDYNEVLRSGWSANKLSDELKDRYELALNISGNGVMGYIEIPSINCSLPIYHGTDETVLQVAIGHLEWTSLPVGGAGTHSVVSGHRGLPSAELFTYIDTMKLGDKFYIHVLDQVLEYRVDNIAVVEPNDTELLQIIDGKDYVTLVTCTPYGINSHRLLVRGQRVENGNAAVTGNVYVSNEIRTIHLMYVIPVVLFVLVLVVGIMFELENRRKSVYHGKRARHTDSQLQKGDVNEQTHEKME